MKRLFTPKKLLIYLVILLIAAAGWFLFLRDEGGDSPGQTVSEEIQADDLLVYLSSQEKYSTVSNLLSRNNVSDKFVPNKAGSAPKFVIFAPDNSVFEGEDLAFFSKLSPALQNEIGLYHVSVMYADKDGQAPDLELTDGKVITTLGGRELHVAEENGELLLVDVKGRKTKTTGAYAVDPDGNRVYFIDSLLLLQ